MSGDRDQDRYWRRRRVRLTAGWTAAVVAVAGAFFWLSGGYDAWRNDRALESVCDGDLAAGQVRALFDDAELTSSGEPRQGDWYCRVRAADSDEDGNLRLDLVIRPADATRVFVDPGYRAAPLGNGWTGSFDFDPDQGGDARNKATASLLLDCGTEPGDGLLATVEAQIGAGDFDLPRTRDRLASVLTETTTSYARRTGCEARPGKPVKDVGVSVSTWDYKPLARVSGTCAGVLDAAAAGRWGVRTAVETVAVPSPVESCALRGLQGASLYDFSAYYGPFAGQKRFDLKYAPPEKDVAPDGHYLLKARCPGAGDTAVYEVRTRGERFRSSSLVLDHPGLRAALQRFADRSAKRHGCQAPTSPWA